MNKKQKQIIDIQVDSSHSLVEKGMWLAAALYVSATGTGHFYETMDLLSQSYPNIYLEEFEDLKSKL